MLGMFKAKVAPGSADEVVIRNAEEQGVYHDYTCRCWGRDYTFEPVTKDGLNGRMSGWGHGLEVGHYLLILNGVDTTCYRITSIRYSESPRDMWFAEVEFAPRLFRRKP